MVNSNRRLSAQFGLRLPEGMRDEIARVADANKRSMNAEIVARLEQSLTSEAQLIATSINQTPIGIMGTNVIPDNIMGFIEEYADKTNANSSSITKIEKYISDLNEVLEQHGIKAPKIEV